MHSIDATNVNQAATSLVRYLKGRGVFVKQNTLIQGLSKALGYTTMNAMQAEGQTLKTRETLEAENAQLQEDVARLQSLLNYGLSGESDFKKRAEEELGAHGGRSYGRVRLNFHVENGNLKDFIDHLSIEYSNGIQDIDELNSHPEDNRFEFSVFLDWDMSSDELDAIKPVVTITRDLDYEPRIVFDGWNED